MDVKNNEDEYLLLSQKKDKKPADIKKIEKMNEGKLLQEKVLSVLYENTSNFLYKNREDFLAKLKPLFINIPEVKAGLWKAIYMGLSERDETAEICLDNKGNKEADPTLRDTENVPLKVSIQEYFENEILPHVPDAWIDYSKTRIGYEIAFTRYFYKYTDLRSSKDIKEEIMALEESILEKMKKVMGI